MHTPDVVKRQNNKNKLLGLTKKNKYDFRDRSERLQVIFDVHQKDSFGVKCLLTG